ncbi:hypothetical protein P171DRAFT_247522 [Karstenula rhodostoma CBS 690.94]|uniref:Uncharacterized protein n=1 Tax=Karstenula rhodostoma CBS 690.94 TaxID=1392251 RepID=A0A9P4PNE0_9PLEO|nr:hypothetical protein P171DRAFT_247522 [Karstenula rhodostoma CBS 690.94]
MANVERPPSASASAPAAAPMSTPDSTPATGIAALAHAPPVSSPADSEKTVIATESSTSAPPRLRRMNAQPGSGAAVFSTDGGRHPRRNPPFPFPPVIVRSNYNQGVFDFAGYWRKKCPEFYHCFFPNAGWGITDLWDDADIHVESPGFLEDVLGVICRDNMVAITNFAQKWGPLNPEKIDKLAKYTDLMYDANDPFAIVDEIFTEGEQDDCPRQFLYHVAWSLRQAMQTYMAKRQAAQPMSSVGPASNVEPVSPMTNGRATPAELSPGPPVSVGPQSVFPGSLFSGPGLVQSAPNGPLVRQPSFPPSQTQQPIPFGGDAFFTGHHAPVIPGPFPGQPRHAKRHDRSGTNSYIQPQMHGYVENGRMPSGDHLRHPSGPLLNGTVHQYGPPMPDPFNPFPPGARLPSNTSVTSPPMHPNQVAHMQMMPRVAMFPPPGPLPPQLHDPAYQPYAHAPPFMNMSNNIQYAQGRNADAYGIQRSNNQSVKTSGLFNPYGAERPDKAGFATTGPRKGGRGNFSNNAGRGRKYSAGTFDRSLYGSYPSDPPENSMRSGNGQICEGPQFRDRELPVSVARRYFHVPVSSQQPRGASQEFRRPVESNGAAVKSIQYSPQDARSDVNHVNKQQQPDHPSTRGSPEARKAKKNLSIKKSHTAREDQQSEVAEVAHSSTNVAPTVEAGDSTEHDEPTSQDKKTDESAATVHTAPVKEVSSNIADEEPITALEETPTDVVEAAPVNAAGETPIDAADDAPINATMDTIAEEHVAVTSELQHGPPQDSVQAAPESISESISADSQGSLLTSPTKVTLSPPADQVESSHEKPKAISSADDSQGQDVAAVPLAQDETPSDDDQKNDLSFHSAQESQPDGDNDDAQKGPGASATNIDTELPSQAAPNDAQDTVQHHEAAGIQPCEEHDEPEGPHNEDIATTSGLSPTEIAKKQGAKQIESLNPYSKTNKALQKKEKQAKKKEKMKEKKKRGKVEATSKIETHAEVMSTELKGGVQNTNGSKKDPAQDEQSDKCSAQHPVEVQESKEVKLEHVGSPPTMQSHKKNDRQANGATAEGPSIKLAAPQKDSKQTQELEKKPKKAPSKIAVPNLGLLPPKLPPTSAATPPHTAYFSVASPTSEKANVVGTYDKVPQNQQEVEGMRFRPNDGRFF